MASTEAKTVYNFESQLELGEMLLNLGRINEAALELRKARDLKEMGAHVTPARDPKHQADLQRLQIALERVGELQAGAERRGRFAAILGAIALLALLASVFTAWIFNRATLIEIKDQTNATYTKVSEILTEDSRFVVIAKNENTRTVREIDRLNKEVMTANAFTTIIANQSNQMGTAMAQFELVASAGESDTDPNATIEVVGTPLPTGTLSEELGATNVTTATLVSAATEVVAVVNVTAGPNDENQLRVTAFAANLRFGPGFGYAVKRTLREDELLTVVAVSADSYWYNVKTAKDDTGWIHASLLKPVSLDWLPVAVAPPTYTPTRGFSTATATLFPAISATNTPRPTAIPPTQTPTLLPTVPPPTLTPVPTVVPPSPQSSPLPTVAESSPVPVNTEVVPAVTIENSPEPSADLPTVTVEVTTTTPITETNELPLPLPPVLIVTIAP